MNWTPRILWVRVWRLELKLIGQQKPWTGPTVVQRFFNGSLIPWNCISSCMCEYWGTPWKQKQEKQGQESTTQNDNQQTTTTTTTTTTRTTTTTTTTTTRTTHSSHLIAIHWTNTANQTQWRSKTKTRSYYYKVRRTKTTPVLNYIISWPYFEWNVHPLSLVNGPKTASNVVVCN